MKKTKQFFFFSKSNTLCSLPLLFVVFLLATQLGWSQQAIGSYPAMNGGFEGIADGGASTFASTATGIQRTVFTRDNNGSGSSIVSTSPRTGTKHANITNTNSSTNVSRIFVTPTTPNAQVPPLASHTIQFFYRTSGSTAVNNITVGVSPDGTPTVSTYYVAATGLAGTSNTWVKKAYAVTSFDYAASGSVEGSRFGMGMFRKTAGAVIATAFDIDDWVIYSGALDETAPDPATTATLPAAGTTSQTIAWTAPGSGVDGGGYMVVRGTSDPTATPNANGIYSTGTALASGQQIVYQGIATSFVDSGLVSGTTYYYRIYTVDKAFNYSAALSLNATTASASLAAEPTEQASNISFSNVTSSSFDINWTVGEAESSIVVIKPTAVDSNPVDATTYTANSVFGSGTQIGTGNYVVYAGTGSSVSVTGLQGLTTYAVNVYTFNGASGTENYLTSSPATATQQTARRTIFSANTAGTNAGALWSATTSWAGGVVPTVNDNVEIVANDQIQIDTAQTPCWNITINTGAKLYSTQALPSTTGLTNLNVNGTTFICNGIFNDRVGSGNSATEGGGLVLQFVNNVTVSGSGTIKPARIRPTSSAVDASITLDADVEVLFNGGAVVSPALPSGAGVVLDNGTTNNNITLTVNSGKTLTFGPYSHLATSATLSANGTSNATININGTATLSTGSTVNLRAADGSTTTLNVNGTLNAVNLNATSASSGVAPVINVNGTGELNVAGIADFSSTTLSAFVSGTGSFTLNGGGTITIVNPDGLEPVAGPIRTSSRTFDTEAIYSFVGTAAQVPGSEFPNTIGRLNLNNPAGFTLSSNLTANSLNIQAGNFLLESGNNLTVNNAITNTGTLTIEDNANLIQVNNTNSNSGTGSTTVNRNGNALYYGDYTLWSSPVNGTQTLAGFSPDTFSTRFLTYNSATDKYVSVPGTTTFSAGTGYLIRMPNTGTTNYIAGTENRTFTGVFTGALNNADVTIPVTSGTYNAVGNPYPSSINANDFITSNSLAEPLYFWRKRNGNVNGAYATYTSAGGVASPGDPTNSVPTVSIKVGQGFIVKSTSTSIIFNNDMRETGIVKKTKKIERNRVWLKLSKDAAPINQMMVAYMTGATSGVDAAIDGKPLNDEVVNTGLNSFLNNEEYVIQGRSLPFDASDEVALAFKAETAGNYSIAIDNVDGLFAAGQDVYLADALTGTQTNLKEEAYNFTADAGVDNTRFTLKYQKTLKVSNKDFNASSVKVEKTPSGLVISSSVVAISKVQVYTIQGKLIASQNNVNALSSNPIKGLKAGLVYIVKVTGANKAIVTKKILN